jgi:putative transcriptional regulator
MPIVVRLDVMLALRKVRSKELAADIGITEANLSLLKSGKVKGIRFATLEAICVRLDCQPGDLLEYSPEDPAAKTRAARDGGVQRPSLSAQFTTSWYIWSSGRYPLPRTTSWNFRISNRDPKAFWAYRRAARIRL